MTDRFDSFLALVGQYEVDPADAATFAKIAALCVSQTVARPGCLYFTIGEDVTRPGVFHLSEGWADRAALDEHLTSAEFGEIVEQVSKLRLVGREAYISEAKDRLPLFS